MFRMGQDHDVLKQSQRIRPAAGRNGAHVPDDGSLRVEIGRQDEETAAFAMLDCHLQQDRRRDELLDHPPQWICPEQARTEQSAGSFAAGKFFGDAAGVEVHQSVVIVGPRNAKGAIRAPVLTPVTTSNWGRVFIALHAESTPTLKAPPAPPPEIISASTQSRLVAGSRSRMSFGASSSRASRYVLISP
jgi:hypothetical protein